MKRKNPIALLGAWLSLTIGNTDSLAQAAPTPPAPKAPIIELSPFQVDASRDTGYDVQRDVAATRLNANLRDIAAAVTVFTKDMMNDLNAINVAEVIAFAPNADISELNLGGANLPNPVRMRGVGANNSSTQDFFRTYDDQDMYKGDRITFNRGPNSLLVGIGDPVGTTTLSTKKASWTKNEYEFTTRFDNWRSARGTFDANVVLIPVRAAVRAVVLQQNQTGAIKPTYKKDKRLFLTGTAKLIDRPAFKMTIRGYYEWVDGTDNYGNSTLPFERFSDWQRAGSPIVDNPKAPGAVPTGTLRLTTGNRLMLVTGPQNPVPLQNWRDMLVASGPANRPIIEEAVYPYDVNVWGTDALRPRRFDQGAAFIEQQIGRNLSLEIAVAHAAEDRGDNGLGAATIFVDPNRVLPDGAPNPNVGKRYLETRVGAPNTIRVGSIDTVRIGAAFKFDFNDVNRTLGKWLGRHAVYALYEEFEKNETLEALRLANATPLPGFPTLLSDPQNQIVIRSYLDLANGIYSFQPGDLFGSRDLPNGIRAEKLRLVLQRRSVSEIDTKVAALMSHFWNGRIATTVGWREDHAINYSSPAAGQPGNLADARGVFGHPKNLPVEKGQEGTLRPVNFGVMVHPLKWLSLGYNKSENFTGLASNQYGIHKQLLDPTQGMGTDYVVRLQPFGDKMSVAFSYYESGSTGQRNVPPGGALGRISSIWETLGRPEETFTGLDVRVLNDFTSTGWESSMTYNPTSNWRIYATVSRNHTTTNNVYRELRAYLDQNEPLWRARGNTPVGSGADAGLTINEAINRIEEALAPSFANDGLPLIALRKWNGSIVTNYTFSKGFLRAFYVGGNVRYSGKMVTNYPLIGGVAQLDKPYIEPAFTSIGVNFGYKRTFGQYKWSSQLGLQNVNHPSGKVVIFVNDNDGLPARGRWQQGLTAVWTNSLRF